MDQYTRPVAGRAALLTIDMQNDFARPDGPATIPGTADIIPQLERLVEAFRAASRPVVHVIRLYHEDGSNVDPCRRQAIQNGAEIVRPGSEGAEVVTELKPAENVSTDPDTLLAGELMAIGPTERILYKPRWSAFYGTRLEAYLRERSVNTVVICGCNFPNCPRTTVYDGSQRDFRIVFVPDATSGTYDRGLNELEAIGVALKETDETIDWITG